MSRMKCILSTFGILIWIQRRTQPYNDKFDYILLLFNEMCKQLKVLRDLKKKQMIEEKSF